MYTGWIRFFKIAPFFNIVDLSMKMSSLEYEQSQDFLIAHKDCTSKTVHNVQFRENEREGIFFK